MKKLIIIFIINLLFFGTIASAQMGGKKDPIAKQGKQYLKDGEYAAAQKTFEDGMATAREAGDKEGIAKHLFLLGNTFLVEAEKGKSGDPSALARQAVSAYAKVVRMRPESGAAKVNLARAYTLLGEEKLANDWYQRAIALKDRKQPLFRLQYASYLETRSPKRAVKQLNAVLQAQPNNNKARRALMRIYKTPQLASRLPKYLLQQVAAGEVLLAQKTALEAVLDPKWPAKNKPDLMRVVTESLTKQHISPRQFQSSDTLQTLKNISIAQPELDRCVSEVSQTMTSNKPVNYRWWIVDKERRVAIGNLLRSRARYYDQANQQKQAESLYSSAAKIVGEKDPSAVQDLVNFYSKRGDLNGINRVSNTYEYQLFQGKGQAYAKGDIDAIYKYHRTLASIYAFQANKTGDWGSTSRANTAAFQLQHAYDAAAEIGKTPDTRLVTNLAKSYEAKGDQSRANKLRLKEVKNYKIKGNTKAANTVLKTVNPAKLSTPQMRNYEQLRVTTPAVNSNTPSKSTRLDTTNANMNNTMIRTTVKDPTRVGSTQRGSDNSATVNVNTQNVGSNSQLQLNKAGQTNASQIRSRQQLQPTSNAVEIRAIQAPITTKPITTNKPLLEQKSTDKTSQ